MNEYRIMTFLSKEAVDWDKVPQASVNHYEWVECEKFDTTAKLVYIKDWGFLCKMTCIEDNPVANYTKTDDDVCLDSCLEFFACWSGDRYLNIESNSIGTLCVQLGPSRADRFFVKSKMPELFEVNPVVENGKWSVTMEVPIEKLNFLYGDITADTFVPGYTFTGNFYKTGGAENTGNEHYAMWNPVGTDYPDFHRPEYFGKLIID